MNGETVRVNMLGEFSISVESKTISDSDNRARKIWLLLAYLIYMRNRPVTQSELVSMLWGSTEPTSNPKNALKTISHRVRTLLNQLGEGAGHTLLIRRDDKYMWNTVIDISFDTDEFDSLCAECFAMEDRQKRLNTALLALSLYKGDFLSNFATESWIIPINVYYHNLYVKLVLDAISLMEEFEKQDDIIELCTQALKIEPYEETIYQHMMKAYVHQGKHKEAMTSYQNMSEILFDAFGVTPSEDSRLIYQEACYSAADCRVSHTQLMEQLKESVQNNGALFCNYDFFKVIYQAEARSMSRSGYTVHVALISVQSKGKIPLAKKILKVTMEDLQSIICTNLRKGDVAACCSISQFIILMPQANYENSCMVCDRIVKAFSQQNPLSPASLNYFIQPMEPS